MRSGDTAAFHFPHFSCHAKKKPLERDPVVRQPSQNESQFLTAQLSAANKQNSDLRKQITDHRDGSAQQIHSLRQQKSSLDARVSALFKENETLKADLERSTKQKLFEGTALRAETESLKRQLADAQRKRDLIKSAVKELTQELNSVTILHAEAKTELKVVKREREAALDAACNLQHGLERQREQNEFRECSLRREVLDLRKAPSHSGEAETDKETRHPLDSVTGCIEQDEITSERDQDGCDTQSPLATDSLSTEILTPRPPKKYHILFNPQIPMTPIRALDDSDYVVNGQGFDSIREPAFATVEFGRARTDFRMVLNEPFSAWGSAERPTMMYIGFEYPDGTSLCYVPIREIRVKYPPPRDSLDETTGEHGSGADYGRDYVRLCIQEEVYVALVEQARAVFATQYSTETVDLPRVKYEKWPKDGSRAVSLPASMKPDARVERKVGSCKQKTLISKELLEMKEDISGEALLAMRFSSAFPNEMGYMLGFKLHGMFAGAR